MERGNTCTKKDLDPVIVGAYRSPICKARRGKFSAVGEEGMLFRTIEGALDRAGVAASEIEEVVVGNALSPGTISAASRMAALRAGIPVESTVLVVNRQCASGLEAISLVADAISAGRIQAGIGAGVESMTKWYPQALGHVDPEVLESGHARECLLSMGDTSEIVSREFGIAREDQDRFALASQLKASEARSKGVFKEEIIPIRLASGAVVDEDEGIRDATMEALSKLNGAFGEGSSSTAGNSSQLSDGAAVVILMSRGRAGALGLQVLAEFKSYTVVGVPPRVMGLGPIKAIPRLMDIAGLTLGEIDLFEINEAFASQCVCCIRELGIPKSRVNVHGGAISLGHPLGATGARLVVSLISALRRSGGSLGVVSMCVGSGFGAAALIKVN